MGFLESFRLKREILENDFLNDKKMLENERLKDEFFEKLQKLSFIQDKDERDAEINKLISLSKRIPEFKDWPSNKEKFWNTEAVFWNTRISKDVRIFIKNYLNKIIARNSAHLSLGSGSCPYLENAICLDFSRQMLDNIRLNTKQKIACDLDKEKIPLEDNSIDFISMVFIVNYLKNPERVLSECKRILNKNGKMIIINSENKINNLYNKFEEKNYDEKMLGIIFKRLKLKYSIEDKSIGDNELIIAIIEKKEF